MSKLGRHQSIGFLRALLRCLLVAVVLGLSPANAQPGLSDAEFDHLTQRWNSTLDSMGADLADLTIVGDDLTALRENIQIVAESVQAVRAAAERSVAGQHALLNALGPVPGLDEPVDDPIVATERSLIMARLSTDLGRVKRCNVVMARVQSLLALAVEEETAALFGAIEKRTVWPISPVVITAAASQLSDRLAELADMVVRSWRLSDLFRPLSPAGLVLLGLLAVTALVVLPLRRWLLKRHGPDPAIDQPSATRRFGAAIAVLAANAILPALLIRGLGFAFSASPVIADELRLSADILLTEALGVVPLVGLASAVLAPGRPQWRISNLTNDAAERAYRAIRLYAVLLLVLAPSLVAISPVYAAGRLIEVVGLRAELGAVGGLLGMVLFGLATLNLTRPRNWRYRFLDEAADATEQERGRRLSRIAMVLVAISVVGSVVLCAIGYINLGVFISRSMTRTIILLGYAIGLRVLLFQGLNVATSAENPVGRWLRHRLVLDDAAAARLVFWLMLAVDLVAGTLVLGMILVMWGLPGALLDQAIDLATHGVDVGGFTLSVVNVGLGLGVFLALLAVVRVFRRFLADRVLVQTRLELGVRDALATGLSYVGYVLATLITLTVLGLDVGNIALIFGALSVGIGFGLQHVVSNFVSGLILLVQRPIKTGDWIVVGDQQGYVRRISVISTEIQTFDSAAVIIPNSTMLSNQVINWHLHSKFGRAIVAVGVSYDSDPEQVRSVLLACAEQAPDVLRHPPPLVFFLGFGDSSLDFELRFYLREIDQRLRVTSELRFAIKKAFAEAGIEIPYPQRDLHIRSSLPPPRSVAPGEPETT